MTKGWSIGPLSFHCATLIARFEYRHPKFVDIKLSRAHNFISSQPSRIMNALLVVTSVPHCCCIEVFLYDEKNWVQNCYCYHFHVSVRFLISSSSVAMACCYISSRTYCFSNIKKRLHRDSRSLQ